MIDKERLRELKNWQMDLNSTLVLNGHEISEELKEKTRKYRDLLKYATEQIERLKDLEMDYVILGAEQEKKLMDELEVLRKRNKHYRDFIDELYNAAHGLQLYPHLVDRIKKLLEEVE